MKHNLNIFSKFYIFIKKMCDLYAELSEYFENIGNLQKAVKYRELVY
jgi:hypothetical protein